MSISPVRQRRLPKPTQHLLGAWLLGLRRLESEARVPIVDLAVLEETLDRYAIPMDLTTVSKFLEGRRSISREGCEAWLSPPDRLIWRQDLVQGAEPTSRYLLEIKMVDSGLPPNVIVGFTNRSGTYFIVVEINEGAPGTWVVGIETIRRSNFIDRRSSALPDMNIWIACTKIDDTHTSSNRVSPYCTILPAEIFPLVMPHYSGNQKYANISMQITALE